MIFFPGFIEEIKLNEFETEAGPPEGRHNNSHAMLTSGKPRAVTKYA